MQEVNEAIRACCSSLSTNASLTPHSPRRLLVFVKQFWDEDAAFWARQMNEYNSMSMDRRLETDYSMSL